MPGFARFGRPSKSLAVAVGIVLLLIVAWVVVARFAAIVMNRSTHRLRKQIRTEQSLAAGYQTTSCPTALGLFMRFMIFRHTRNGVLLSLLPLTRKAFART